jgi:hypothetical protein
MRYPDDIARETRQGRDTMSDDAIDDGPPAWLRVMDGETTLAERDALDDLREQLAIDDDLNDAERKRCLARAVPLVRRHTRDTLSRLHARLQH